MGEAGAQPLQDVLPITDLVQERWVELLGVPAVGSDDDCFELGGQQRMAAAAVALLGERREVRIARHVREWFERAERRASISPTRN